MEDAGDYADRMCAVHGHPCMLDELTCWCGDNVWPAVAVSTGKVTRNG